MSTGGGGGVSAAIKRAEQRASVITSLDEAYGNEAAVVGPAASAKSSAATTSRAGQNSTSLSASKQQSVLETSRKAAPTSSDHRGNSTKRLTMVVDALIGDLTSKIGYAAGVKDYEAISSAIENKSIVLDNSKQQTEASKSQRRKRMNSGLKQVSNRFLKRKKIFNPFVAPTLNDLVVLHDGWLKYSSSVLPSGIQGSQFQARFNFLSLLGAKVIIADYSSKKLIGKVGIVTSQTSDCFYLSCVALRACKSYPKPTEDTSDKAAFGLQRNHPALDLSDATSTKLPRIPFVTRSTPNEDGSVHIATVTVVRIIRQYATLSILLPTAKECLDCWEAKRQQTGAKPTVTADYIKFGNPTFTAGELAGLVDCINLCDSAIYSQACVLYGQNADPSSYSSKRNKTKT